MAFQNNPNATATLNVADPVTLRISDGDVALDAGRYPYADARVVVPLTSESLLEQISAGLRVAVDASSEGHWETTHDTGVVWVPTGGITADLTLVSREVSFDGKELTLGLASDEVLLDSWADVVDDKTPRQYEASLRALVNYVLGKAIPGAALEPGTVDADLTAAWPLTNLLHNGNARTDTADWGTILSGGVAGTVSRTNSTFSLDGAQVGARVSLNVTTTGTGLACLRYGNSAATNIKGIRPGAPYTIRVGVYHTDGNARTARVWIGYKDDQNKTIRSHSRTMVLASNTWGIFEFTTFAPAGASQAALEFGVGDGLTSGKYVTIGGPTFVEGTEIGRWFDYGRPNDSLYAYALDGDTAGAGPSTRTPFVERLPELFTWAAGVSAWEFLEPLTAAAGLRLFCDERRRWHLVNPAEHTVPGRFSARVGNTVDATDLIDREDEEAGITGVVCRFSWTDADGTARSATDRAGVAGKVKVLEFDRAPSPGVAAAHLSKVQGQNRTQDVTVQVDYTVRPGQEIQITLPGIAPQIGTVTRANFELATGLMSVKSAGLRETPEGAINLLTGTIDALTGTINEL